MGCQGWYAALTSGTLLILSLNPLLLQLRAGESIEGARKGGSVRRLGGCLTWTDAQSVCRMQRAAQAPESPPRNPGRIPGR